MQVLSIFGGIIALTILSIVFVTWGNRRRERQLSAMAGALGLSFRSGGGGLPADGIAELPLLALGTVIGRARVSNVMTGTIDGVSLTVFDYAYWTGSVNDQRFDYAQTVVCFRLEDHRYPTFTVYPKGGTLRQTSMKIAAASAGALATLAKPLGDQRWTAVDALLRQNQAPGIEIGASPDFSRDYAVAGSDGEAVTRILRPEALDSLARDSLALECSGQWLAVYRKNRRIPARDVPAFLRRCVELRNALFAH